MGPIDVKKYAEDTFANTNGHLNTHYSNSFYYNFQAIKKELIFYAQTNEHTRVSAFHVVRINKSLEIYVRMCWKPFECLKTLLRPSIIAYIFLLSFFAIIPSNSKTITPASLSLSLLSVLCSSHTIYMEVKCPIGKCVQSEVIHQHISIPLHFYVIIDTFVYDCVYLDKSNMKTNSLLNVNDNFFLLCSQATYTTLLTLSGE